MSSPSVPRNAYTDSPEQHPNLILGSIQLFFWLFFHPSAFRNHLKGIDPAFDLKSKCRSRLRWQNPALGKLLLQVFLLPIFTSLLIGLVLLVMGESFDKIIPRLALGATVSLTVGMAVFTAASVAGCVVVGAVIGLAWGVAPHILMMSDIDIFDIWWIIWINVSAGMVIGVIIGILESLKESLFVSLPVGFAVGWFVGLQSLRESVGVGLAVGFAKSLVIGLTWGIVFGLIVGLIALFRENGIVRLIAGCSVILLAITSVSLITESHSTGTNLNYLMFHVMITLMLFVVAIIAVFWGKFIVYCAIYSSLHIAFIGRIALLDDDINLQYIFLWLISEIFDININLHGDDPFSFSDTVLSITFMYGTIVAGAAIVGVTINLWRPIITYPLFSIWNALLYYIDLKFSGRKTSLLGWHSAFWDEWQRLPLIGLDKHLTLVKERNHVEAQTAIEYLTKKVMSAKQIELEAKQIKNLAIELKAKQTENSPIELEAGRLERCTSITAIRYAYGTVPQGILEYATKRILEQFNFISQDVNASFNQSTVYHQRITLEKVAKILELFAQELTRSSNEYAPRFRPIAIRWQQIVTEHIQTLIAAVELRQEIDDPYIFGVPLNEQVKLFMGRTSIGLRIEKLILDRRRPPLLLYGQRRMGKTSLLNNLGRLLPNSIIPMFVDLQGAPTSASDHAGFLYNLAKGMTNSAKRQAGLTLPLLTREALTDDPFTTFDEWLDDVEQTLDNNTALLALDEFEVLDKALTEGRFSETDVLGMLRHLIQHRPRFKVLLAGSHTIEEFQRWASYLINVQVVPISYLNEPEARQLIERPIPDFTLRYEPDAVERVLSLTRCHPCLVQLLCSEIVALKNEQEVSIRRLATVADVEEAIPEALSSGSFFFADIERNQVDELGLAILRFLAAQGEGASIGKAVLSRKFPDRLNPTLNLLLQRELIEESGGGYGFQVELIRRWFARDIGE